MNPLTSTLALLLRHPGLRLGVLVALLGAGLALAVGLGQWRPVAREHAALRQQIAAARRAAIQAQDARSLLRAYGDATQAVAQAEQKLQAPAGQSELVTRLAQLAEQHEVQILGQSYEEGRVVKSEAGSAGSVLVLTLKLEAGYPALREFLAELPRLKSWVDVEEARLERSRESPELLRAQLRLAVLRAVAAP